MLYFRLPFLHKTDFFYTSLNALTTFISTEILGLIKNSHRAFIKYPNRPLVLIRNTYTTMHIICRQYACYVSFFWGKLVHSRKNAVASNPTFNAPTNQPTLNT